MTNDPHTCFFRDSVVSVRLSFNTGSLRMARVTPYILCFGFTQDSSRVPIRWDPRGTLIKKCDSDALHAILLVQTGLKQSTHYVEPTRNSLKNARVTPCILEQISCCVLAPVLFFADCRCLCFCRPAFASALVSYIEAARGRVRGESDCNPFSESASF